MPEEHLLHETTRPVWPTSMKVVAALVAGALFSALALVQWVPDELPENQGVAAGGGSFIPVGPGDDGEGESAIDSSVAGANIPSAGTASAGGVGGGAAVGSDVGGGSGGSDGGGDPTDGGKLECAPGRNGGETDTGVTGDKIRLAANVVTDGPGANFLSESPDGMEAVVQRVNNQDGGICGRRIELKLVNDSWDAQRGHSNIKTFIQEGYFALPVVPSSEGLSSAIQAGDIEKAGIPVVGTDGMRKEQYDAKGRASWVGPVATATVSQVRIMAAYSADKLKARKFGIVYDKVYRFGVEGADAFEDYVKGALKKKYPDVEFKARMAVEPLRPKYQTEANQFLGQCSDCDLVVLLLEPETGKTWMSAMGNPDGMTVMGAQPLFNDKFASGCGSVCNGVRVWSGYNPAIGGNRSKTDIARFVNDVKAVNPSADETNQFLMGAYLGMELFVDLLKQCSPNLTRQCVKDKLHQTEYKSDFSSLLRWQPGNHFANTGARAYSIAYDGQKFSGFKDEQTGFVPDPTPGVVPN